MLTVETLFRRDGRPDHVLAFGFKLTADSDVTDAAVCGHPLITCVYPNPAVAYLKRKPWATLHRRLGDAAMIHLLLYTAIFVEVEPCSAAGNFIQVSGQLAAYRMSRASVHQRDNSEKGHDTYTRPLIPVQRLLHDMALGDRLRDTHPLQTLSRLAKAGVPVSNRSAARLIHHIFGEAECSSSSGKHRRSALKLKPRFAAMMPYAKQLLSRFKRCNMEALLRRHCAFDAKAQPTDEPSTDELPGSVPVTTTAYAGETLRTEGLADHSAPPPPTSTVSAHSKLQPRDGAGSSATTDVAGASEYGPHGNRNLQYTPCGEVRSFVVAVLNTVVPKELWGCTSNRDRIFDGVGSLLKQTKYEKYYAKQVFTGLKVRSCRWLHAGPVERAPSHEHKIRMVLLEQWVHWLFDSLVVPVIRAHFYVTESCTNKNRLFFYRKPLWRAMQSTALQALREQMYEPVNFRTALSILKKQKLGFSYVRMVPKATGMRCLVNMSRRPAAGMLTAERFSASINQKLRNLFHILSFEKTRHPEMLGASVFGMDDVYRKLSTFARTLQSTQVPEKPRQRLYFVSVDVKKCFDTVQHDKLLEIIATALREDEYVVRKFTTVVSKGGRLQRAFRKYVDVDGGPLPELHEFAVACAAPFRHAVVGNQVSVSYERKPDLLALLREHVLGNFVKADGQFFRQACGIAQGSVLSSLLCSYFYGDLEKKVLRTRRDPLALELMMRQIDDFLLITTDYAAATRFLRTMFEGVAAYGCTISRTKTKTNFEPRRSRIETGKILEGSDVATPSTLSSCSAPPPASAQSTETESLPSSSLRSTVSDDQATEGLTFPERWMPWCGVLINTVTLQARLDLNRYEGSYIRDTITAELGKNPGESILDKLLFFLKLKLHPLLIDEGLNSQHGASLNLFHIFRLCALKLACHLQLLPPKRRVRGNPAFFMRVIGELMQYPHKRIKSVLQQVIFAEVRFTLRRVEVNYLAVCAFLTTLESRQSDYTPLISELKARRRQIVENLPRDRFSELQRIVLAPENEAFKRVLL